ncbi:hypothetical protein Syun_007741 [Stephania yunnanensis]|uniref:FAF domain-containing protein n=1 Tax=Stephania yunnanensis TaxID=152371 RepID=A0AAP0L1M1_9MAGN
MMTLFKNIIHSLLDMSSYSSSTQGKRHRPETLPSGGALILLSTDALRSPPNVVEASVVSAAKTNSPPAKKDPPVSDDIITAGGGGGSAAAAAMSSCTESLGFESSDQMEEEVPGYAAAAAAVQDCDRDCGNWSWAVRRRRREREREERKEREIPPPIPSLNSNGQSRFFLRPVRANGRLVLTEVRINRPDQIFRASRQDGRLRLHVAESHYKNHQQPLQEQQIEEAEMVVPTTEACRKWRVPVTGSEGLRRCHEITRTQYHHHHHHNHMTLWNHQCVTTR